MKNKSGTNYYIISGIFMGLFLGMAICVCLGFTADIDILVTDWVYTVRTAGMTKFMTFISWWGKPAQVIILESVFLAVKGIRSRGSVTALFGLIGCEIPKQLGKRLIRRPRPDSSMWLVKETGFSFPSGHASTGVAFFGFYSYRLLQEKNSILKIFGGLLAVFTCLIPVSRVYLGVHYTCDVIGGVFLGASVLVLEILADRRKNTR